MQTAVSEDASAMRLLTRFAIIFFGTLLTAAVVALGAPGGTRVLALHDPAHRSAAAPPPAVLWHQLTAAVHRAR